MRASINDRITGLAAEVAFFGILALFPALIALAAAVGSLDAVFGEGVAEDTRRQVLDWLRSFLSNEAAGVVDAVDTLFRRASGGTFTVASIVALLTASRGTNALMRALAIVHERPDARSFFRRRLVALVLLVATVVAITIVTAAFVVGPLFGRGEAIADRFGFGSTFVTLWEWFRFPMVFAAIIAWAAVVLHLAPDDYPQWRFDIPGAVLTAVLWLAATGALRLYLAIAGTFNQVFGILSGLLIVLVWLYLLALSLLFGAELNSALSGHHRPVRPS